MLVAGMDKDFMSTAEGAEAQAARSRNPETKATFLKIAKAYRQLAEHGGKHRSMFPSLESRAGPLSLPLIWLGPACFCGFPSNDAKFSVVQGGRL